MSLENRLIATVQAFATDVKFLLAKQGDLTTLTTTAKTNLVASINEINGALAGAGTNLIDDTATTATNKVFSASHTRDLLAALKNEILGGASSAFDTLLEIQNKIGSEDTAINNLLTAVGLRVSVDAAQSFTAAQQAQGRSNIGAAAAADLATLTNNLGNIDRDFAADYAAAKQ